MPITPNRPKTMAPIFQRRPELNPDRGGAIVAPVVDAVMPPVLPLTIFAARHDCFEFITAIMVTPFEAKFLCFENLPLFENGWEHETTTIRLMRYEPRGAVWCIAKAFTTRRATSDFVPADDTHPGGQPHQQVAPQPVAASRVSDQFSEATR